MKFSGRCCPQWTVDIEEADRKQGGREAGGYDMQLRSRTGLDDVYCAYVVCAATIQIPISERKRFQKWKKREKTTVGRMFCSEFRAGI